MPEAIPSFPVLITAAPTTLFELLGQYQEYAQRVRQVQPATVLEQRTYLERLIANTLSGRRG